MNRLVIKGAFYYDKENDVILIPHFTGEYGIVDCYRLFRMEELKQRYNDDYINKVKDNPIEFDGNKYYDGEYSPKDVGDWELLSDLSNLEHIEESYDF